MDTFVEQIVAIKKTAKTWIAYFGIAMAAIILMTAVFLFLRDLLIILDILIVFSVFKLYSFFNIEYEYIITNSTMDIDKIIAKSSRKRMISFDLTAVLRVEKYSDRISADLKKNCFFACNPNDENMYMMVYKTDGKPQQTIVFAPDDRMIEGMKKFLPRHISENLK